MAEQTFPICDKDWEHPTGLHPAHFFKQALCPETIQRHQADSQVVWVKWAGLIQYMAQKVSEMKSLGVTLYRMKEEHQEKPGKQTKYVPIDIPTPALVTMADLLEAKRDGYTNTFTVLRQVLKGRGPERKAQLEAVMVCHSYLEKMHGTIVNCLQFFQLRNNTTKNKSKWKLSQNQK